MRWNKQTHRLECYDYVKPSEQDGCNGVWGNDNGFVAKTWNSSSSSYVSENFSVPSGYAFVAVYYDSLLDTRRGLVDTNNIPDTPEDSSLSINWRDADKGAVTVSPNPTSDFVTVTATHSIRQIDLLSIDGRLLQTSQAGSDAVSMSLRHYPKGTYLLRISLSNGWCHTVRVIKC